MKSSKQLIQNPTTKATLLGAGLLSIIVASVIIQSRIRAGDFLASQSDSRQVASFDQSSLQKTARGSAEAQQIVSEMKNKKSILGQRPSATDELLVGALEGQYQMTQGQENETLILNTGSRSVRLDRVDLFLQKHLTAIQRPGVARVIKSTDGSQDLWLVNSENKMISKATVELHPDGNLKSISIR